MTRIDFCRNLSFLILFKPKIWIFRLIITVCKIRTDNLRTESKAIRHDPFLFLTGYKWNRKILGIVGFHKCGQFFCVFRLLKGNCRADLQCLRHIFQFTCRFLQTAPTVHLFFHTVSKRVSRDIWLIPVHIQSIQMISRQFQRMMGNLSIDLGPYIQRIPSIPFRPDCYVSPSLICTEQFHIGSHC